jgi:DNA-directed RNA polymerase specialized sigma24 family protein
MSSPGSVTALVEQLKAGNHEAAQRLWEPYYPRLVALARRRLQNTQRRAADEEDVALSAFASFCRGAEQGRFPRLHDRDNLWGLLVVLTARKAADLAQHNARQKRGGGKVRGDSVADGPEPGPGMDAFPDSDPTPDEAAVLVEEFEKLLAKLTDPELRQIALWKMEGYTHEEVAQRIGRAPVTVNRGLALIRKIFSRG